MVPARTGRSAIQSYLGRRFYYGWIVVAVTFVTIMIAGGIRSAPAILINPLEDDPGRAGASISFGISIGLLLNGLASPAAGALVDRLGPRRMMLASVLIVGARTALSAAMTAIWQFPLSTINSFAATQGSSSASGTVLTCQADDPELWFRSSRHASHGARRLRS